MSEQLIQICRFCQRNIKLAFYCEDCGISCCSDCLIEEKVDSFICQECNSKNVDVSDSGKKKSCNNCGTEDITQISQLLKSCPKCHSHRIINVYEKKEKLEKGFLDLIKNVRTFIDPLNEVSSTLSDLKQKVIDARAPPIKCYHYSNMEADLLSLFKLLNYAKDNLLERIRNLIQNLSMNKDYFFNIYSQPNSNIKIIGDILENLERNYSTIEEFIENNVNTINASCEPFSKNLKFIQKITNYFKKYVKFLNLAAEEKPIYAIYAKITNGLSTHDKYKKNKGVLFITNFDLSFVHEYGRIKRKKETILKAPVNDLIRVKIIGKIFKKLFIEFPYGRYEFTFPPNSIFKVMDYILLARTFDETIIYDEDIANRLYNIEIDLGPLISFIEEAINSFFSLKCTYNSINQKQGFPTVPININSGINPNFNNNLINNNYISEQNLPKNYPLPLYGSNPLNGITNPNVYQNYIIRPENRSLCQNDDLRFLPLNNPLQSQMDINYYRPSMKPNYQSANRDDDFFLQNFYDTSRIQNYQPSYYTNPLNNPISSFDEKNFLMRRLEQLNKASSFGAYPNQTLNPPPTNNLHFNPEYNDYKGNYDKSPFYKEFSKNHLSELFEHPYKSNIIHQELEKNKKLKQNKKFELEQERFSLDETLKALDSKFESGNISEIDYFKNFKKLQKELYKIDKKINDMNEDIKERDSLSKISKNLERRRYFS